MSSAGIRMCQIKRDWFQASPFSLSEINKICIIVPPPLPPKNIQPFLSDMWTVHFQRLPFPFFLSFSAPPLPPPIYLVSGLFDLYGNSPAQMRDDMDVTGGVRSLAAPRKLVGIVRTTLGSWLTIIQRQQRLVTLRRGKMKKSINWAGSPCRHLDEGILCFPSYF